MTVAVNTSNPDQYEQLMRPDLSMRGESQTIRPMSPYYTPTTVPPQQLQKALHLVTAFARECVEVSFVRHDAGMMMIEEEEAAGMNGMMMLTLSSFFYLHTYTAWSQDGNDSSSKA